ncbi:Putative uncharacterized protein [Moritella viscosa]|nr:Putative uncharacterized protein [Moritella viscosa]
MINPATHISHYLNDGFTLQFNHQPPVNLNNKVKDTNGEQAPIKPLIDQSRLSRVKNEMSYQ